ncbi:MAG TPA: HAD-IC family P-type ATPase [Ktedonobacteraceae bacterium]|nr:HAD-IC family P-type ATPase [Ktedonobacteraceae bacterium]
MIHNASECALRSTIEGQGLSESEATDRRRRGLSNVLPVKTSRTYAQIVRENVLVPVNVIMFALGLALVVLGQVSDALISVGVAFFNVLVGTAQEVRAKRVLDRITLLTRPTATVLRDGQERIVDPRDVVVGDLLVLRPGDQIIVDGRVVSGARLEVDESLLSGEAELVVKQQHDWLYSGSFCASGRACYLAEKVGAESVAGQLALGARAFRRVYTPLQRQITLILQVMLLVAFFFELLLALAVHDNRVSLVDGVKMAVVVIGIVPKGLLLATSVAYALGAVRIVGKGALVQQANAIEELSNVDVLCLDKTGTLTANALALERLSPLRLEEARLRQLLGSYVASASVGNLTSAAIGAACPGHPLRVREEVAFSSARKWSAISFDDAQLQGTYVLGAPDILQPSLRERLDRDAEALLQAEIDQGRRVLLFASCSQVEPLHDSHGDPILPHALDPLGLLSLRDQLRPEAQATLSGFAEAGIQLKVLSGDHPKTVAALAKQAGFAASGSAVSGEDLANMDAVDLAQAADEHAIFGRVTPQQKTALVQALRDRGHIVAMIGDGVNDVLALKQANLGIAMQSGSAATRGVADIVLLEDSFAALPQVFREGQRIRQGMHNILKLFLTRVLYMMGLLVAIMIVDGFPFVPRQNAILTLLTEGIPALALASWARPRAFESKRTFPSLLHFVLPAAGTLGLAALGVFMAAFTSDARLPLAQSALTSFTITSGLLLIPFVVPPARAWVGGSSLEGDWRPTLLSLGLLAAYAVLLAIPPLRAFFALTALDPRSYLLIGLTALAWAVALRWVWRARLLERFLQLDWREE